MKYYLITGRTPAKEATDTTPAEPAQDIRIVIGQTNPFDSSGKPFKPEFHQDFGITTMDSWKRLLIIYGQRITHEYILTPQGLRQDLNSEVIPASHLFALLNDGFVKEGRTEGSLEKVIYWKQRGRIEDDTGKIVTAAEMLKILENQ